jgi:hypothetical protein
MPRLNYLSGNREVTVKKLILIGLASVPVLWSSSCTTEDSNTAGTVFTCDAHASVAELCIEEPNDPTAQKISKSTCASAGGSWSDNSVCPGGYQKKCLDGNKDEFFYGKTDAGKDCSELVGILIPSGSLAASRR